MILFYWKLLDMVQAANEIRLLADHVLATRLGAMPRKAVQERYSVEAMTQPYEQLWRRLAA
jgi:hypothetical protein